MRTTLMLLMLALLAAPVAAAQEKNDTAETSDPDPRPDDAAWVDDCPPDMMCAYGGEDPQPYGNESCIECSGPSDGPGRVGPDDCIDCFPAPGETCMDGEQEGETCQDDVQYIGGPSRGPEDGSCENCRGEDGEEAVPISAPADNSGGEVGVTSDEDNAVPAPGFALAFVAIAIAAVLVIRKL